MSLNTEYPGGAEPANSPSRLRITPRALLEARRIGSVDIHPDGHRVVFEVDEASFADSTTSVHLWLTEWVDPDMAAAMSAEGSDRPGPEDLTRQLTFSAGSEWDPRWSPDGRYLAFLSDRPDPADTDEDSELTAQVWVMPADGGEARKLTSAKDGVLLYRWHPVDANILFVAQKPLPPPIEAVRRDDMDQRRIDPIVLPEVRRTRSIWSIPIENGSRPELIWHGDPGLMDFDVSPNGERLCFVTNYTGDPNEYHCADLWLVQAGTETGPTAERICERAGDKSRLVWSPTGDAIAFLSSLDPDLSFSKQCAFVHRISDGQTDEGNSGLIQPAQEYDFDLSDLVWSRADGRLYALASVGMGSAIVRFEALDSALAEIVKAAPRSLIGNFATAPESIGFAWVSESLSALPEIKFTQDFHDIEQLTAINLSFCERYEMPRCQLLKWSAPDGLAVEGVYISPGEDVKPDHGAPPLVVQLHGGPKGRAACTLLDYFLAAVWAAEGYAVLAPNYRGSEGYGNSFALASRFDLGRGDYQDVMAGVEACVKSGWADASRLGVMGGSYGGFLTNIAICESSKFSAAISMFGIFSLQSDAGTSSFSRWNREYLGAYPWEAPELYHRLSPATRAVGITTPTLIIHGEQDENTFIGNSLELYHALRTRKIDCALVKYPREQHGLSEPNHRIDEMRRCLSWMDRYLRPEICRRAGEAVISADGDRQLNVLRTSPVWLPGSLHSTSDEQSFMVLEVLISIHALRAGLRSIEIRLEDVGLVVDGVGAETVTPVGVMLDAQGGKRLLKGNQLSVTHRVIEGFEEGLDVAFAFEAPTSGSGELRILGFGAVRLTWEEGETAELEPLV